MKAYSPSRGSEWRKWDLHVHTPESGMANGYHNDWDAFVKTLLTNAVENEVVTLGITDYFTIDGYKKLKTEYLNNDDKLNELFNNDKEFIDKAKSILFLPNIEFRLNTLVDGNRINYHVLLSDEVAIEDIEEEFLHEIDFVYENEPYDDANKKKLKKQRIEELGRKLKAEHAKFNGSDFEVGCMNIVVSCDQINSILTSHKDKFRDNYIIAIPVDEDLAKIDWSGQGHQVRKGYYQHANIFFASNTNTIEFGLGKKHENKEEYLREFKSLKPCIIGCDSHSCDDISTKLGKHFIRYNASVPEKIDYECKTTWIKADNTFNGFRQILFEPESRVKIQSSKPEVKVDRLIISSLTFRSDEKLFGDQKILLNDNLNSIIGGKSSGKSLLLHSTASAIDKNQVAKISDILNIGEYKKSFEYDLEVEWKDGVINRLNQKPNDDEKRKITYIPQLYINYLAEKNNKDELNKLLLSIIQQDESFRKFYTEKTTTIKDLTSQIDIKLSEMLSARENAITYNKALRENGDEKAILKSLEELLKRIEDITKLSSLSESEQLIFNQLRAKDEQLNKNKQQIKNIIELRTKFTADVIEVVDSLCGVEDVGNQIISQGKINSLFEYYLEIPDDLVKVKDKLIVDLTALKSSFIESISSLKYEEQVENLIKEIDANLKAIKPFTDKLHNQKEIAKLQELHKKETEKLEKSKNIKKKLDTALSEYRNQQTAIKNLLIERNNCYINIRDEINTNYKNIGDDISLSMNLVYKKEKFSLYEQVNKTRLKGANDEHEFWQLINGENGSISYDKIPNIFEQLLRIDANSNVIITKNQAVNYPLNQGFTIEDIFKGLVIDEFELNFDVIYKNDNLLQMSPGKKGTVLLILFLHISSAEYPILIDQPEDNLDNRTIYELLCQMIRTKKIDRQIIIVSHNANLVVSTDSENIIVANQEGQTSISDKNKHRFEYVNGALELSFENNSASGVLYQKGIKEHVCDILEGGDDAFRHRERKYSLRNLN